MQDADTGRDQSSGIARTPEWKAIRKSLQFGVDEITLMVLEERALTLRQIKDDYQRWFNARVDQTEGWTDPKNEYATRLDDMEKSVIREIKMLQVKEPKR